MMYVAKIESGRVKLYDAANGQWKRDVGESNAISANVQGNLLSITYANNPKVRIYNADNGQWQRDI